MIYRATLSILIAALFQTHYCFGEFKEPKITSISSESERRCDSLIDEFETYEVIVNENIFMDALESFWTNSGLCPPDPHQDANKFLLSKDMDQNFFHIGSLPHNGISQVRIHWMLDLVHMRVSPDLTVSYNFSFLDDLIYKLWKNYLYPGFELMGNPSNYFTDFENATQVYLWRNLVQTIADRYIGIYGSKYLLKWNFETWNEPDHHDFDSLNFTIKGFLNYYDACSEGLKLADERLRFGGPGGSCRIPTVGHSPFCWALLEHCFIGKNFFTGETGVRMDFISFHKKGNASTDLILQEELQTIKYIQDHYPVPVNVPFYNDEADPMKNWAASQWWRADATYAAMVVKIVLSHIYRYYIEEGTKDINFGLLSSDNAFLSYYPYQFSERTLLARFQINNTFPRYVEFVKKPVYSIFGLLSKMCQRIFDVKLYKDGKEIKPTGNDLGVIATECMPHRKEIVIILYNSADANHSDSVSFVSLVLNTSSISSSSRWVLLEVNNKETNPYFAWQTLGMPAFPSNEQFSQIKEKEEPLLKGPWKIGNLPPWKFDIKVLNPGVTVINICQSQKRLKKVRNVRFLQIRNVSLQISWTDKYNRCILTYNVEQSLFQYGPYFQLNKKNFIFPSYWHACQQFDNSCRIEGFYRMYAVDYWGKRGPYSAPTKFSSANNE